LIVVVVGAVGHAFLFKESSHGLRSHHKTIVSCYKISRCTEFGVRSRWCWEGISVGGHDRVGVGVGVGGGVVGVVVVGAGVVGVDVEIVVAFSIVVFVVVGDEHRLLTKRDATIGFCILFSLSRVRLLHSGGVLTFAILILLPITQAGFAFVAIAGLMAMSATRPVTAAAIKLLATLALALSAFAFAAFAFASSTFALCTTASALASTTTVAPERTLLSVGEWSSHAAVVNL
jgi:hypothetical protein